MAKRAPLSKKEASVVDGVSGDSVFQWYMDVYDIQGEKSKNVILFVSKNESSRFEQAGVVDSVTDGCAGKEGIPCNVVKMKGKNLSYKLDPLSFDYTRIKEDAEHSLKAMGWNLGEEIKGSGEIVSSFKAIQHSERLTSSKSRKRVSKKQKTQSAEQHQSSTSTTSCKDESLQPMSKELAIICSSATNSGVEFLLPSDAPPTQARSLFSLDVKGKEIMTNFSNIVKKKGIKIDSGFHMYEKYFLFGSTSQFPISVERCFEAPPLFAYRTLCWDYVEKLTKSYLQNPMSPATAAYLMPITQDNGKVRPMHAEEVDEQSIHSYNYWIIAGLHSIHAAKIYIQSSTPRCLATKHLYNNRNARILVDCPAEMCIELSRMTNMESHNIMKNAPYLEQLQQLRDQWIAFGSPPKPQQGLPKNSSERVPWERFIQFTGDKCASRDCHMIVCTQEAFDGWVAIMKKYLRGELLSQVEHTGKKGRQPSPATFRCLMGLKDGDVFALQQEIDEGHILFLRNKWDRDDILDMDTRAKQIKQDRVLREELVVLFNGLLSQGGADTKTWEELVEEYDITDAIYAKFVGVCYDWVLRKLTRGIDAGPLPSGAKDMVNFLLGKNKFSDVTSLPWKVYVVGCNLEAFDLIHNVYKDPITIGVVVLDAAHGAIGMTWDTFKFSKLVTTLLQMTCEPKQFTLLSFLTRKQMAALESALDDISCRFHMLVGSVDFLPMTNTFASGAMDSFVVLTLVSMEKKFINLDRYVNNGNKPCILDDREVSEDDEIEEDMRIARAILKKKKHVIRSTIEAFNDEHEVVLDIFACGIASKLALKYQRKTIAVVCNTQEQRDVEAVCWSVHGDRSIVPTSTVQEVPDSEPQLPLEGVEEASHDIASLIMKEKMKVTSDPTIELGDTFEASLAKNDSQLCVILDLNGVLLQRCFAKSKKFQSLRMGKQWVVLRSGFVEFFDALFDRFQVGIWSTALHKNVMSIIKCVESHARKTYPFFMVWGQEQCYAHATKTVYRPDKMGVEAMFKPLKYVWDQYADVCTSSRTILIDDSPYKGCLNPIENCIYPTSFDVNHEDLVLLNELLPYLLCLDSCHDIREVIRLNRYGQEPIQFGHVLYAHFKVVINEWATSSIDSKSSSSFVQSTNINKDESHDEHSTSTTSQKPNANDGSYSKIPSTLVLCLNPHQISKLRRIPLISTLKDMTAMHLAQQLGYNKKSINGHAARCFLQKLQNSYVNKQWM